MKTKFFHQKQPKRLRCTVAVDVPPKEKLVELLNLAYAKREPAFYTGKLGIARVSPKDKFFVKKLGREISLANASEATYHLVLVIPEAKGTKYHFMVTANDGPNAIAIKVNFFVFTGSNVVHIDFVDVTAIKRV